MRVRCRSEKQDDFVLIRAMHVVYSELYQAVRESLPVFSRENCDFKS